MLPANRQDVWQLATEKEKIQALVTLSGLPSRATSAGEIDNDAFLIALEGVTRHGLSEAVKFILKGALGHAFMPSPPELRIQCDKAMEWHEREAERSRRQARVDAERPSARTVPSNAAKARVAAAHAAFLASYDNGKQAEIEADRAALRARYGMTPEVLASVKDNPKARERMGRAS